LLEAQDFVVHRRQALAAAMTRGALDHRLAHEWQVLLPSVYLCHRGEPSRRQRLIAALLYAGPTAAIDAVDACHFHGIKAIRPDDERVHVVAASESSARSAHWVIVRRTSTPLKVHRTERLRYVDPATAVIAAARCLTSERTVVALLSDAVQRGIVSPDDLLEAHRRGSRVNARLTERALRQVRGGVRSAPEAGFRSLAESRPGLPKLLYNRTLRLPSGRKICPDAIAPDAPLIHETNGALAHRRQDLFDDMQERHDSLTAAGFTVLHNTPRRIRDCGDEVIEEFERCYLRLRGTSWPAGVVILEDAG
jgi:hypothetical protein